MTRLRTFFLLALGVFGPLAAPAALGLGAAALTVTLAGCGGEEAEDQEDDEGEVGEREDNESEGD